MRPKRPPLAEVSARGIAAGARPDRSVLTSGFLSNVSGDSDNVVNSLGEASLLTPKRGRAEETQAMHATGALWLQAESF